MEHHVGIDVSLELSSLCVLDATGKVIREAKVASEPEALVAFLRGLDLTIVRVGLEAGPLSQWLYDGLHEADFDAVLLETRHVKAALSAMAVKTDRRDARGIAQLLRMGWYRPVHRKSVSSQEVRALLGARKQLQIKVGCDNEFWPSSADEFWPTSRCVTGWPGPRPRPAGQRRSSGLPVMLCLAFAGP